VQFLPGALSAHVRGQLASVSHHLCDDWYAARFIGRDELGLCSVSKTKRQGSIPWRPANVASSSPGGDVGLISRTRRVQFPRSLLLAFY
jgi:hypothetical protein